MERSKFGGHLAAAGAYAIFGFNIVFNKDIANSGAVSPMVLFTLRAVGATALFQRNIGSLEGLYGEAVSARTKALLAHNLYDTQGTDLHNEGYARFFDSFGFCV